MPQRSLRQILRRTLLSVPLLAGSGCSNPSPPGPCGQPQILLVGGDPVRLTDGGLDCSAMCFDYQRGWSYAVDGCQPATAPQGSVTECHVRLVCFSTGRRPSSLVAGRSSAGGHPVGKLFAEAARLEAASITAFRIFGRELLDHGAPPHLVTAADHAASDEIEHARVTAALARRYGAMPEAPRFTESPETRTLEEFARENAIEGCVREAYGALMAAWQGQHAQDPAIRRAMTRIGEDEFRHANLALGTATWADGLLSRASRARIGVAREEAVDALRQEQVTYSLECEVAAGMPPPQIAKALVGGLSIEISA
jgi:hypothetical protein